MGIGSINLRAGPRSGFILRSHDKIKVSGPDIALLPATAQGIALALHELATNAAKHGALSSTTGKVSLAWQFRTL
jgi:two-component sensor histidine kinase